MSTKRLNVPEQITLERFSFVAFAIFPLYVFISYTIRLILWNVTVYHTIYYLIFVDWEKRSNRFYRSLFTLLNCFRWNIRSPAVFKTRTMEKYCILFLKGNMSFGAHIHRTAAGMQLKSAASGPVSGSQAARQGWTTLWKEGAFILRKEIYGTWVVCHQSKREWVYYFYTRANRCVACQ